MSPRAAWRLESLGFSDVCDFVPGKAAWLAMGWPWEGALAAQPSVESLVREDVAVARLGETVGDAERRCSETGLALCLVVNTQGIFMGRLREPALQLDPATLVDQAMEFGASTVRPSEPLGPLTERMAKRKVSSVTVTDLKGRLIGALLLEDALSSGTR